MKFVQQFLSKFLFRGGVAMSLVSWGRYPAWFRRTLSSFKQKQYLTFSSSVFSTTFDIC